jgi:hypothetical protein
MGTSKERQKKKCPRAEAGQQFRNHHHHHYSRGVEQRRGQAERGDDDDATTYQTYRTRPSPPPLALCCTPGRLLHSIDLASPLLSSLGRPLSLSSRSKSLEIFPCRAGPSFPLAASPGSLADTQGKTQPEPRALWAGSVSGFLPCRLRASRAHCLAAPAGREIPAVY